MKIAILMFGQPRFLEYTINLIKDEFNLPGHEVHYFAHFWDKIGYLPCGDEESYNIEKMYKLIKTQLPEAILPVQPIEKNIVISSYNNLDKTTKDLLKYIMLFNRRLPITIHESVEQLRYKFGQHWSMRECFKRIQAYEKQNNFQYDVVIKVRTDIVYKLKETYNTTEEYYKAKEKMYTDICLDIPLIKCTALRYVDLTEKRRDKAKDGYNQAFYYFHNKHFRIDKALQTNHNCKEEVGWIKHTEDYNKRLAFNDWTLIANRKAAQIMFGEWFENYFLTLSKDILNNKTTDWFISQSDHSLQGQLLLNYNIAAQRISPRRDARLLHPSIIKDRVTTAGKIKAESEEQIKDNLLKFKFKG